MDSLGLSKEACAVEKSLGNYWEVSEQDSLIMAEQTEHYNIIQASPHTHHGSHGPAGSAFAKLVTCEGVWEG